MHLLTRRCLALLAGATVMLPAFALPPAAMGRLTLFGVDMANATVSDFLRAAKAAGANSKGRKGPVEDFDVQALGIPSVKALTVTYVSDRVMAAQYVVDDDNEKLRKMLLAKYGPPNNDNTATFGSEYAADGSYSWNFPAGMQVVFKKPFIGPVSLSYINTGLLKEAEAQAEARANRDAANTAKSKSNVF